MNKSKLQISLVQLSGTICQNNITKLTGKYRSIFMKICQNTTGRHQNHHKANQWFTLKDFVLLNLNMSIKLLHRDICFEKELPLQLKQFIPH